MTNSLLKVVCGFALLGAFIALLAFRYAETVTENTPAISAEFEEPAISQRAATLDTKPSESANVNSAANYDQEARLAYEDYMAYCDHMAYECNMAYEGHRLRSYYGL